MRTIGIFIVVMIMLFTTQGCAVLEPRIGKIVGQYCEETTDTDQQAIRERMDKATDPHSVRVNCARE